MVQEEVLKRSCYNSKKEVTWVKEEESKEETKSDRYLALGSMGLLLILFFILP